MPGNLSIHSKISIVTKIGIEKSDGEECGPHAIGLGTKSGVTAANADVDSNSPLSDFLPSSFVSRRDLIKIYYQNLNQSAWNLPSGNIFALIHCKVAHQFERLLPKPNNRVFFELHDMFNNYPLKAPSSFLQGH